jgi:putative hydrolase
LQENARQASSIGLELIACTNHGPSKGTWGEDGPHIWHFDSMRYVPRTMEGITVLRGAEANVLDANGTLDIDDKMLKTLDFVIASCHDYVYEPGSDESFLRVYTALCNNPHVDMLGHACRKPWDKHLDEVIQMAKQNRKIIEINCESFNRAKHRDAVKNLINRCAVLECPVAVNSDAHICYAIGDYSGVIKYMQSINFPEHLIINRDKKTLLEFLDLKL